jgi:alkylation response protein AidB-like acyl-CoA dehydrogenase
MTTHTAIETSGWIGRVRALAPIVEQWRDHSEQERHIPRPLFEALCDAGVFTMSAATAVGGAEVAEATALHVIEALARQDGAVGWNVMIASNAAIIASYLPAETLREVYRGGASTVLAGALLPKGAALPVPGGFRLTGRWTFASGCQQASWMLGSSPVMAQGTPRLRPDGRPDVRTFFVPIKACEILDTWYTALPCGILDGVGHAGKEDRPYERPHTDGRSGTTGLYYRSPPGL